MNGKQQMENANDVGAIGLAKMLVNCMLFEPQFAV